MQSQFLTPCQLQPQVLLYVAIIVTSTKQYFSVGLIFAVMTGSFLLEICRNTVERLLSAESEATGLDWLTHLTSNDFTLTSVGGGSNPPSTQNLSC